MPFRASSVWVYSSVPVVLFITVILSLLSLTSPIRGNLDHHSLLSITSLPNRDGPSVWLGLLGSCSRPTASSDTKCDYTSRLTLDSKYNISVLPSDAPLFVLRSPPTVLKVTAWFTTLLAACAWLSALSMLFFLWFETWGGYYPSLRWWLVWTTLLLSFLGIVNSLIINYHFETARKNFNLIITRPGAPDLGLVASRGKYSNLTIPGYVMVVLLSPAMLWDLWLTGPNYDENYEELKGDPVIRPLLDTGTKGRNAVTGASRWIGRNVNTGLHWCGQNVVVTRTRDGFRLVWTRVKIPFRRLYIAVRNPPVAVPPVIAVGVASEMRRTSLTQETVDTVRRDPNMRADTLHLITTVEETPKLSFSRRLFRLFTL